MRKIVLPSILFLLSLALLLFAGGVLYAYTMNTDGIVISKINNTKRCSVRISNKRTGNDTLITADNIRKIEITDGQRVTVRKLTAEQPYIIVK